MSAPPRSRPTPLADALVSVAVRALPAEHRDRYSDEFRADLCFLSRRRQIPHAAGLLVGVVPLRAALVDSNPAEGKSVIYWRCRLGRHRYLVVGDQNPENRRSYHLECSRCLKFKETKEYEPSDGRWMSGGVM